MKKILTYLVISLLSPSVYSATIASCQNPKGHVYYPFSGMTLEKDSGWFKDGISGGITQLEIDNDGNYDIQFVDVYKQIVSSKDDGAKIIPFAFSEDKIGITSIYLGSLIETYAFFKEGNGKLTYTMTQTKINTAIPKASVMKGTCSFIDFSKVK